MYVYLFIYLFIPLFTSHTSINPLEAAKPTGYRISKSPSDHYTQGNQYANRLKMDFNGHGSKFINDYTEFQYFYIDINVNRHKFQSYNTDI